MKKLLCFLLGHKPDRDTVIHYSTWICTRCPASELDDKHPYKQKHGVLPFLYYWKWRYTNKIVRWWLNKIYWRYINKDLPF